MDKISTREALLFISELPRGRKSGRKTALMNHYKLSAPDAKKLLDRIIVMEKNRDESLDTSELIQSDNNLAIIDTTNKQKAVDDTLKEFGIDKDDIIIERFRVGKWGPPEKQNAQVRIEAKPRVPQVCQFPEIKAIRPEYSAPIKKVAKSRKKLKRALIVPDSQIGYNRVDVHKNVLQPYHDFRAMDLLVQIAADIKPDVIIMLGDMLDLPNFGRFAKSPEMLFTVQPSLNTLRLFIDDLRAHTPEMVYIYGNHEARFKNFMEDVNVEGSRLKKVNFEESAPYTYSLEYFLGLDDIGVKYFPNYPQDEFYLNDHLAFSHGDTANSKSGGTVGAIIQKDPHVSRMVGHIHRCEQATKTTYKKGDPITNSAFSCGTICRLGDFVPQNSTRQNWQQGFATVDYEEGDGLFNVNLHHIQQGKVLIDGKLWQAKWNEKEYSKRLGFEVKI